MNRTGNPGIEYDYSSPEITKNKIRALSICEKINGLYSVDYTLIPDLIVELFGSTGENPWVNPFFQCDDGKKIHVGKNFFANNNVTILDIGGVFIGDDCKIGPYSLLTTVNHPLDHDLRKKPVAYLKPIHIGDNVWIGGHCTILPGVTIGSNSVIAAGSVVNEDVPEGCIVGGVPAKVLRRI